MTKTHRIPEYLRLLLAIFGSGDGSFSSRLYPVKDGDDLISSCERVLATLPQGISRPLRLRFGLDDGIGRTQKQVGEKLNRTGERIRQLEKRGLRLLRHPSRSNSLRKFVVPTQEERELEVNRLQELPRLLQTNKELNEKNKELRNILERAGIIIVEKSDAEQDRRALQEAFQCVAKGNYRGRTYPSPFFTMVWNALKRAGIFRLSQLKETIESGKRIKRVGPKGREFFIEVLRVGKQQ